MPSLARHPEQPPASAWAEEVILSDCLRDPAVMEQLGEIGPELQFPEFRAIWRAMQSVRSSVCTRGDGETDRAATGECFCSVYGCTVNVDRWYSLVHDALEQAECGGVHDECWYAAMRSERARGLGIEHPLSGWWGCRAKRLLGLLNSGTVLPAERDLALRALHACTERRRLIDAAQRVARAAWQSEGVSLEREHALAKAVAGAAPHRRELDETRVWRLPSG